MNWKNKRVLVTGAGGFIGSHLTEELVKLGADVTAMVKNDKKRIRHLENKIKVMGANILNVNNLNINNIDVVFHLAALTNLKKCFKSPKAAFKINTLGTINLLQNCESIKKFVYISTLGVYGEPKYLPVDENHSTNPIEPYAASKLAAECFIHGYCSSKNIDFSIARLFNVYGASQDNNFVIPKIIIQFFEKEKIKLKNPALTRDFIYVKDAVKGLIRIAEKGEKEAYNVGSGKETSIKEIIKNIAIILEKNINTELPEKNDFKGVQRSVADIRKIKEKIGWTPEIDLKEGLIRTIRYYKNAI